MDIKNWQQIESSLTARRNALCQQGADRHQSVHYYREEQADNNRRYDGITKNKGCIASSFK